jgi:hypothetical protein
MSIKLRALKWLSHLFDFTTPAPYHFRARLCSRQEQIPLFCLSSLAPQKDQVVRKDSSQSHVAWVTVPRSVLHLSQAPRSFWLPQIKSPCHAHLGPIVRPMMPHLCETHPSATWLQTAPHSCCWGRSVAGSIACHPLAHPQWRSHHSRGCSLDAEQSGPRCLHPQTERAPEGTIRDIVKNTSPIRKHEK